MYCMSLSCHSSIIWSVWLNRWVFVNELSGCGFEFRSNQTSDVAPASSKEYYDIHAKIQAVECGFTLKLVSDMKITYSQTHHTDKYSTQLNHLASLAKWLNVGLQTKWLQFQIPLLLLKLEISHLYRSRSFLTFRQLQSVCSL